MNNKKAQGFEKLIGFSIAIAIVIVTIIVTLMMIAQGKSEISSIAGADSLEYNMTTDISEGYSVFPSFMPIIIIAGIGMALLAIVVLFKSR